MARPQALDYEDRKRDILRAAAVLFARQGYNETLLEDVARQCGISKSALYHYHRSKHAVLLGLIQWKIEDLLWKVEAAIEAAGTPRDKLLALTTTLVNEYIRSPEEITVLLTQVRHLEQGAFQDIAKIQERFIARLALVIQALRPDIDVTRKKTTALAMLFFGMTNWIHVWYKPSGSIKPDELAEMITRIFLDGLNSLTSEELA